MIEAFTGEKQPFAIGGHTRTIVASRSVDRRPEIPGFGPLPIVVVADVEVGTPETVFAAKAANQEKTFVGSDEGLKAGDGWAVEARAPGLQLPDIFHSPIASGRCRRCQSCGWKCNTGFRCWRWSRRPD